MYAQEIEKELHDKVIKLLRELFKMERGALSEMTKTARHNEQITNWQYFLSKIENMYDPVTGAPKQGTEGKMPFAISYYRQDYAPETIAALNKMGIPHIEFTNGSKNFIITDNDKDTLEKINHIRFGQVKEYKDITVNAKMEADEFTQRFSSSECVSADGFSKPQVELFSKYAKEHRIFFTAIGKENGYSVYVPKENYTPEVKKILSQIAVSNRVGIDALYVDLTDFEKTVKKAKAMDNLFSRQDKVIYIDLDNPSHYIIGNDTRFTVYKNGSTNEVIKDTNNPESFYRRFNAELSYMKNQQSISYDEFVAKYKENIVSPKARELYLRDGHISDLQRNKTIVDTVFASVEKRYASLSPREVFLNDLKTRADKVYALNEEMIQKGVSAFIDGLENNKANAEAILNALESGDYSALRDNPLITSTELEVLNSSGEMPFKDFKAKYIFNQIELEMMSNPDLKKFENTIKEEDVKAYLDGKENAAIDSVFVAATEPFIIQEIREVKVFKDVLSKENITPDMISERIRDKMIEDIPDKTEFSTFLIEDTFDEMKDAYNKFHIEEQNVAFSDIKENGDIDFSHIIDPKAPDKSQEEKEEER